MRCTKAERARGLGARLSQEVSDGGQELVEAIEFVNRRYGPVFSRFAGVGGVYGGAEDDHLRLGIDGVQLLNEIGASSVGKTQIEDDDVGSLEYLSCLSH